MTLFYWLNQISAADRAQVGDKAFYLGQLMQNGYPVIPGFVISTPIFRKFLEQVDWLEPLFADLPNSSLHLNTDHPRQLQGVAQTIRQEIAATELPGEWRSQLEAAIQQLLGESLPGTLLILRPSLTWQGATDSNFSVRTTGLLGGQICHSEPESITFHVKQIWARLFKARSLLYWQRSGIQLQQLELAVLVQPLCPAIASGTLQSDEVTFDIQATYGLGFSWVRGEAVPDFYQVEAGSSTVKIQQLGSKFCTYHLDAESGLTPLNSSSATASLLTLPAQTEGVLIPEFNRLRIELLDEGQQQRYALPVPELDRLIHTAQRLRNELGTTFQLEWLWGQLEGTSSPQIYLLQAYPWIRSVIDRGIEAPVTYHVTEPLKSRISQSPLPFNVSSAHLQAQPRVQPTPNLIELKGIAAAPGQKIAQAYVVQRLTDAFELFPPGSILVAPAILPSWLPQLKNIAGIVAEQGGMTSHGAILARELGLPAVTGVQGATQRIQTGMVVLIDGDQGEVQVMEQPMDTNSPSPMPDVAPKLEMVDSRLTWPTIATQLMVNLNQVSSLERAKQLPLDGVGLLRSEMLLLEVLEGQHPYLWLQQGRQVELMERMSQQIQQFAAAFYPRPVFYRSSDLRTQELQTLVGATIPVSPSGSVLGVRGTFSYLLHPDWFALELLALKQVYQAGYPNLRLLLPFVRSVAEFSFCQHQVQQIGLLNDPQFQLWIMAEVPSVLFLLPEYVRAGVQGIAIGTNDLTQLLLGLDRDESALATQFDRGYPIVLKAVTQLIQMARELQIPCSICGYLASQTPEAIDSLIQAGITTISVDLDNVESTYRAIARAEQRLLLESIRLQSGA